MIGVARRLLEQDVGWIEEPFYPTDLGAYRALRSAVSLPIASGEREWTGAGYERLIGTGTVDLLGIDPARAEGVTGFRRVDEIAGRHQLAVNAHAWSTAITTAASLHLSIASSNMRLFELKPFDVVVQTDLADAPICQHGGRVEALSRPGLGIEINEDVVARYRVFP